MQLATADQAAARARFQDIQTANDGIDDVLGAAGAAEEEGLADDAANMVKVKTVTTLAVVGIASLAGLALLITRSVTRPLVQSSRRSRHSARAT